MKKLICLFMVLFVFSTNTIIADDILVEKRQQEPLVTLSTDSITVKAGEEINYEEYLELDTKARIISIEDEDIEEEGEHLVKFLAATLSGQTLCLDMEVNVLSEEDYAAYIKKKNTQTYSSNADSVCIANSGGDAMSIAQCFVGLSGWCTTIAQNFINAYLGSGYNIYDTYDISYSEAQPGDIIYYVNGGWGMQHYAVYLGNDTALQGNMSGGLAKIGSIYLTYGSEPIFKRLNGR